MTRPSLAFAAIFTGTWSISSFSISYLERCKQSQTSSWDSPWWKKSFVFCTTAKTADGDSHVTSSTRDDSRQGKQLFGDQQFSLVWTTRMTGVF
jgi:hypothetical protein